jgi:membrane-associated protease RseP (regulator of RpoE activity)
MVGSLLLHEEGHMLAATALGVPVREIGLCMGGAYTRRAPARCRRDEVIISAAGPLLNLCLVLPLVFLPRIGGQIALCNLVLGIVNLVPFPSSDGLHILRMLCPEHSRLVSTDGNRLSLVELPGASAEYQAILIQRTAIEPLMALTGVGGANEIAVASTTYAPASAAAPDNCRRAE